MRLANILLMTFFAASAPALSFAVDDTMKHCPQMSAVKAVDFDFAQSTNGHDWMVGKNHANFGTNYSWMFAIIHFKAADKDDALKRSKSAVNYLQFINADEANYTCHYAGTFEGKKIEGVALALA